jgi:hypothetical protein
VAIERFTASDSNGEYWATCLRVLGLLDLDYTWGEEEHTFPLYGPESGRHRSQSHQCV